MSYIPFWLRKGATFTARVEAAMVTLNKKTSGKVTENRSTTIGASEINSCARRVIMGKLKPEQFSYSTLAKFYRGHRQEEFNAPIHRIIASEEGLCWIPQLRVHLPRQPRIRAHVDNVYYWGPTRRIEDALFILVVEEKNAAEVAAEPLDDYIAQVHYQLGLLKLNYPKAKVHGVLYQTDLNGDHTDYGTLYEVDMALAEDLYRRGEQLLAWLDAGAVPDPEPSLKCGWCPAIGTCPKWHDPTRPPVPDSVAALVQRYYRLKQDIEVLESEKDAAKEKLTAFFSSQGKNYFRGEAAPGYFVKLSEYKPRLTCDTQGLQTDLPEVAAKYLKRGNSSTTLSVTYAPNTPN